MNQFVIDKFKFLVSQDLSKLYASRNQLSENEKSVFENWFWKVKPLFQVEMRFPNEMSVRISDTQDIKKEDNAMLNKIDNPKFDSKGPGSKDNPTDV